MRRIGLVIGVILIAVFVSGCGHGNKAAKRAQDANNRLQDQVYDIKNFLDFRNYNFRNKLEDDPTTIMWCTFSWPGTGGAQQLNTVPIAGKLTSSGKRPYRTTNTADNGAVGTERAGPDAMFGSSVEYRYGPDPTLTTLYEFTGLPSFCTNKPTVWQQNKTNVMIQTSATLSSLSDAASAALQQGNEKEALRILKKAESK